MPAPEHGISMNTCHNVRDRVVGEPLHPDGPTVAVVKSATRNKKGRYPPSHGAITRYEYQYL